MATLDAGVQTLIGGTIVFAVELLRLVRVINNKL